MLLCLVMIVSFVAPRAGAWIETFNTLKPTFPDLQSRPARARGLKQLIKNMQVTVHGVAPRAGAWIETLKGLLQTINNIWSRPARARGLKRFKPFPDAVHHLSRAPRGRVD